MVNETASETSNVLGEGITYMVDSVLALPPDSMLIYLFAFIGIISITTTLFTGFFTGLSAVMTLAVKIYAGIKYLIQRKL